MTNKEAIERLEELKELDALGAYYIPAIDLAIAALSRDMWISVNQRLPKEGQVVLAQGLRTCTTLDAIKMVEDSPAADVRENVIRTQGDKLRAASEDKLIEWYCRHRDCGTCDYGHDVDCSIRAWLKSPVEVEDGDYEMDKLLEDAGWE